MANTSNNRTQDGFVHYGNNQFEAGLNTEATVKSSTIDFQRVFDVIIVGAGFTGLIAARELSRQNRNVLLVEARDRLGGRTFTTKINNEKYEIGGTWIHWSQPHVWTETTRYGLSISETKGVEADQLSVLTENGTKLKSLSMNKLLPDICDAMNKYSDVDGALGRTVLPLPHDPLASGDIVRQYDQLSMQDRLDQIKDYFVDKEDLYEFMYAYISMNSQGQLNEGGFIDHLRWWALGDFETLRLFDKSSRFKIVQGSTGLAKAIWNDCQNVKLLLSTPIKSVRRTNDNQIRILTENGQELLGRSTIITIPLNTLRQTEFIPALKVEKQRAINEGQCRGGNKFAVKLKEPIGNWTCYAPYPSPITMAFTDDEEGTIIIAFGVDDLLDIKDFDAVEREFKRFLPDIKIDYVVAHDWRNDSFAGGTWGWYRPGQMTSSLLVLQEHEPPIFFASSDSANGWRGFIDGAIESGLTNSRHVEQYLRTQSFSN